MLKNDRVASLAKFEPNQIPTTSASLTVHHEAPRWLLAYALPTLHMKVEEESSELIIEIDFVYSNQNAEKIVLCQTLDINRMIKPNIWKTEVNYSES